MCALVSAAVLGNTHLFLNESINDSRKRKNMLISRINM